MFAVVDPRGDAARARAVDVIARQLGWAPDHPRRHDVAKLLVESKSDSGVERASKVLAYLSEAQGGQLLHEQWSVTFITVVALKAMEAAHVVQSEDSRMAA
jgi:hypothetical protein